MTVLAIDPGLSTGWVLFSPKEEDRIRSLVIHGWGENDSMTFLNQVWNQLCQKKIDLLVVERWTPRGGTHKTWQPDALEIIGTLKWMVNDDPQMIYFQGVPEAMAYGTTERVNPYRTGDLKLGKGGAGHAIMALKHGLLFVGVRWNP